MSDHRHVGKDCLNLPDIGKSGNVVCRTITIEESNIRAAGFKAGQRHERMNIGKALKEYSDFLEHEWNKAEPGSFEAKRLAHWADCCDSLAKEIDPDTKGEV